MDTKIVCSCCGQDATLLIVSKDDGLVYCRECNPDLFEVERD